MEFLLVLYILSGTIKNLFFYIGFIPQIDITGILGSLLILFIILKVISKRQLSIYKRDFYILSSFLFFWFWCGISVIYSNSTLGISKFLLIFTDIIPILIITFDKKFNYIKFYNYFILITIVLSLIYIPIFLIEIQLGYGQEMSAFMSGYLILATCLGASFLIITTCPSRITLISNLFFLKILIIILIFLLGGRGPILFLLLCYGTFLLLNSRISLKINKHKLLLILCFSLFASFFIFLFLINNTDYIDPLIERTKTRFLNFGSDESSTDRIFFFTSSLNKIFSSLNTFIFGIGLNGFGIDILNIDSKAHPHNLILEVFLETGLIGLILISIFFYLIFNNFNRKRFLSFYVVFFLLLNIMKSSSLPELRLFITFFALYGCHLNINLKNNRKNYYINT